MQIQQKFSFLLIADGSSGFKAERNRYHLYVSKACPFAHRVLVVRALKGLEDVISMDQMALIMEPDKGWEFDEKVNHVCIFKFIT